MATRSRSAIGGGIGFILKILVPVAVLFVLMNMFYAPSCGRFSCGWEPAWLPQAHAATDGCPDSVSGAMSDAKWAADRYAEIKDEHDTTGVFYDEDGQRHGFSSGDEKGSDAERASRALRDVGAPPDRAGRYPAASHVEIKVAALMREAGVLTGVLVINHRGGPCAGVAGLSCSELLSSLLPAGASLRVWFPRLDGSDMAYQDYAGR